MPRRIALVIPALTSGGAERVMTTMANFWASRGWCVTIITFDDGTVPPFYPLNSAVQLRPLAIMQPATSVVSALNNNLVRIRTLRRALSAINPDNIVSFMTETNCLTCFAAFGLGIPVIISERVNPKYSASRIWNVIRRVAYPLSRFLVVQTNDVADYFSKHRRRKVFVVPNPVVPPPLIKEHNCEDIRDGIVIAVGRLAQQKRYDLLLRAFSQIENKDWKLQILGTGSLQSELKELSESLGVAKKVSFLGAREVYEYLPKADIFVMSSEYEGFPNALCEAMACGLAVIAADCCSGPRDIITDGVNGVLTPVGDVAALTAGLNRLIDDCEERIRLGKAALEIVETFNLERVMERWENLLDAAVVAES